jgi:hypothetical protein
MIPISTTQFTRVTTTAPCTSGRSPRGQLALSLSTRKSARSRRVTRASGPRGDGDKDNIDWDGAWTDFQKQQRTDTSGSGSGSGGGSTGDNARRPPTRPPRRKASSPLDEIKRAEDGVLSPWSSALFAQLGVAVVLLLLVVMVVGGADIHDSRCTLPWC